jgi:superfamily II DNA or RNA helicase
MITLTIDNSDCRVTGLNAEQFAALRKLLLYRERTGRWVKQRDKKTKKIRMVPEVLFHFLIDKRGNFPTGLLYIVEDFLLNIDPLYVATDARKLPVLNQAGVDTLFINKPYSPYPEQMAAAAAALEHGRGIIVGPTGVGKSAIAAEICDAFRVKTLIVVPSLELKRQLTDSLRDSFGAKRVGPLVMGKAHYFITVENVDALDSKKPLRDVDLVIVDEFHHSGAATYRDLNRYAWAGIYFKIGLTATPFRSVDAERLLLESVLSQVIYRIDYSTAVDKGYIVPMEAYYIDLPEIEIESNGTKYATVYKELVTDRDDRNEIIAEMTVRLASQGVSTLVLVKQVAHGETLQSLMLDRGMNIPFVKGENDDNRKVIQRFSSGEDPGIVGTTGVIGEGVDTKAAEWAFLAGGGKSKNAFMQQVGRVFRRFGDKETGKIVMFRDASHAWMLDHFDACCQYLKDEYGVIPTKLDFK